MKKHFLIYGHGGSYNHGCEAIVKCTIKFLREIVPDCFITLSTHFPEQDKEFALDADEFIARNLEGKTNEEIYAPTLDKITPDTTVIHTGGDNYCYVNWQRYAMINRVAKERGCKSILWGCSIDEDLIDDEMFDALQKHDLICARECITYDALIKRGLKNVCKVSDIAFDLEAEPIDVPLSNYIAINLSPLVYRKNEKISLAVQNLIGFILEETDYNIALVPHVVVSVDNDYEILSSLNFKDSGRVQLFSDKLSASQYKYIISKAELCVAARTHATIAAYSSCVPTLAIGYSTKARGIAADLGFSEYVVDIKDENINDRLLTRFRKMLVEKNEMKKRLERQMPAYKEKVFHENFISFLKISEGEEVLG